MKTYIFISYGHDEYASKVEVIMKSLDDRKEYQIWWDKDIAESDEWVREIEDNLNKLISNKPDSCFIYIVTPYSTSDKRYNFCINEILRVLDGCVRILPIRLSSGQMPLPIGGVQWFDLTQCEIDVNSKDFQNKLEEICKLIDSKEPVKIDGKQGTLHNILRPCLFTLDIDKHLQHYCPRQWLLEATKDWLDNRKERMLLVEGGPGTGKTAFSLWIATHELPERIQAWHLCQYNDVNTRSLLTCVRSLTWYLASRLPYFYDSLEIAKMEELIQGGEESAGTMLKDVVLRNLKETHISGEKIVILIDALDEASENGVNKVADILAQYVDDMPEWLRFIITTRNDSSVTLPLKDVSYVIDLDGQSNRDNCFSDVRAYIRSSLDETILAKHDHIVDLIAERSGNVILFAKLMCAAIAKGERVDMSQLPHGLSSYFDSHMRRYFGSNCSYDFERHALPIIHLMLASYQPIKRKFIYQRLHETEDWCKNVTVFKRLLIRFGPLLKNTEEYVLPFHKSLCDWFSDSGNNAFYVSREDGLEKMSEWGMDVLADEFVETELADHFYMYQPQYLIEAKKFRELINLFSDCEFWKRRRDALGIDMMLQRMLVELSFMNEALRNKVYQNQGFKNVLYFFGKDLFNKGLFVQLKKNGFNINLSDCMSDEDRMTAFRYYYINGDYSTIGDNQGLFSKSYAVKELEPQANNMLGLATKKLGQITQSESFFRKALILSEEQHNPLERVIYYHLNLSRVLTLLCRFDEGRKELNAALNAFYNGDWRSRVEPSEFEFASRQLELAVRYVNLETELFSTTYRLDICERELAWADELYSSEIRIDRYYPRHLQSKVLFLLREHRFDEIESVMSVLSNSKSILFDNVRSKFYTALYLCATGRKDSGLQTAKAQLVDLLKTETMFIERTEFMALIDTMENQSNLMEVSEELKPWYHHVVTIVKQITS